MTFLPCNIFAISIISGPNLLPVLVDVPEGGAVGFRYVLALVDRHGVELPGLLLAAGVEHDLGKVDGGPNGL